MMTVTGLDMNRGLLYLRTALQHLEEYARVLELRLAVGCCVHRFPSFFLVSTC